MSGVDAACGTARRLPGAQITGAVAIHDTADVHLSGCLRGSDLIRSADRAEVAEGLWMRSSWSLNERLWAPFPRRGRSMASAFVRDWPEWDYWSRRTFWGNECGTP